MWPADKRFMSPEQFRAHVATLDFGRWRPIGVVWHNTASPTLRRWHEYSRQHWMDGLESYYKGLGWNGGPHLFCDDGLDGIGLFNPLNARGTHSPSFNAQYIGIEHVGDYNSEDDDAGSGLQVKMNGIMATAIICARLGIPVDKTRIKLHKEDPRTNHDCPGRDMAEDKDKSIQAVLEYMGEGGDHAPSWDHVTTLPGKPIPLAPGQPGRSTIDDLNVRSGSGTSFPVQARLRKDEAVVIIGEAMNGSTKWLRIERPHNSTGWVSAAFVSMSADAVPGSIPGQGRKELFRVTGKMSTFGGPKDTGMKPDEGLALFKDEEAMRQHGLGDWLLSPSTAGAPGLGRRLVTTRPYLACRWNAAHYSLLRDAVAHVSANGKTVLARPVDWGPNVNTGRVADLSPGLAAALGLDTGDSCTVVVYEDGK